MFRIRGGLAPALPRPFDQLLFALPFGAIVFKASDRNVWWFLGVMSITTLALTTGHGQYFNLGRITHEGSPETLDFIVQLFFGKDPGDSFWRDAFGLALTGLIVTLPCGIALSILKHPWVGSIIAISGTLKALAYYISWEMGYNTELGEYLTGAFLWLPVILLWNKIK